MQNTNKINLSHKQINLALNGGTEVLLAWPTEVLGAYGRNAKGDDAMDAYVASTLILPEGLAVSSCIAGRVELTKGTLTPAIVLTVRSVNMAKQIAACISDRVAYSAPAPKKAHFLTV